MRGGWPGDKIAGPTPQTCSTRNLLYTMGMILKLAPLLLLMGALGFAGSRVYELRTYTCYEGKLDALKARFRDHTIRIFKKHGIESVGYFVPQDGDRPKNTLIYILAHPSREAATKNWADFVADPEWKKVAAESEANGKIVQKIESIFMEPTEFSQLK
jgi:NIPSNAP